VINQANYVAALERLIRCSRRSAQRNGARLRALAYMRLSRLAEAATTSTICSGSSRTTAVAGAAGSDGGRAEAVRSGNGGRHRAIQLDPNNALAYLGRGLIKGGTGKVQDALADYDRSISLNVRDPLAFTERGLAYVTLNQVDKALLDFDQALVLNQSTTWRRRGGVSPATEGPQQRGQVDINAASTRIRNNQPRNSAAASHS